MATEVRVRAYLNPNIGSIGVVEEYGLETGAYSQTYVQTEDLDAFLEYLRGQRLSDKTVNGYRKSINLCLSIIGTNIRHVSEDEFRDLAKELYSTKERAYAKNMITRFGRYYRFCYGIDPPDVGDGRRTSESMGSKANAMCNLLPDEVREYRKFISGDHTESTVNTIIDHITRCLMMIYTDKGFVDLKSITEQTIFALDRKLESLKWDYRRAILRSLGDFVFHFTGRNPYYSFMKDSDRRKRRECRLDSQIDEYIGSIWRRNRKKTTIDTKRKSIVRMISTLDDMFGEMPLSEVEPYHIMDLRYHFDGLKDTTVYKYVKDFCDFVEYATGNDLLRQCQLEWNLDEPVERKWIFREDWEKLKAAANPMELLILYLGAGLGLRRAEIAGIRLQDIEGDRLTVWGKGVGKGKKAVFTLRPKIMNALSDYLEIRSRTVARYGDSSDRRLFINGTNYRGRPMTPDAIGQIVRRVGERAGVDLSTHSLRRFFCMTMYDSKMDEFVIQRKMRHSSIEITRNHYLYVDPRKMALADDMTQDGL